MEIYFGIIKGMKDKASIEKKTFSGDLTLQVRQVNEED